MPRIPRRVTAPVGLVVLIAFLLAASAAYAAAPPRKLSAGDRAARAKLLSRLGREAVFDEDPQTATPRALGRLDGTLTGAQPGDAADIAMRYVSGHAGALGLGASDLSTLRQAGRVTAGGVTYLRWRQEIGGVPSLDNELRAGVDADGRVVGVLGAPRPDLTAPSLVPALDASQALAALARDVGSGRRPSVTEGPTGPRHETRFSSGDVARLVLVGETGPARLAWHVTFDAGPDAWYDAVVDATTGAVLRRSNMVKHISGSVFSNYPGARAGGTQQPVTLDAFLNPGVTATLTGPNAHAWSDLDDVSASPTAEAPGVGEDVVPGSYPFQSFDSLGAGGACDAAHHCSWDPRTPNSWQANRAQNAVQAFWYVNHYHDHLKAAPISFDRASGNLEGAANGVDVETDDGANTNAGLPDATHLDNADMVTPPDGNRPRLQLALFRNDPAAPFRDANGGDDASVVYHEYTHGLSNRLVTTPDGTGALTAPQSGAMGEGWSDWYAKDFLVAEGLQPDTAAPGEVDMGAYLDAVPNIVRTQPLDCPVGRTSPRCPGTAATGPGGYTYGDFARIVGGPEVHADGEIWGETLWDLRRALGSQLAEALVTGGMRISPPQPSMLEERNAILLVDSGSFGGAHLDAIWAVFAQRGMGVNASTVSADDLSPVEDFTAPPPVNAPAPAPGQAPPAPAAPGGATPQPVPANAVATNRAIALPTVRIEPSSVRGRALVTIGCATACTATATMTLNRASARLVGLAAATRLAHVTRRLAARGRRTFGLSVSRPALRRLRARGVLSLATTVSVTVRDRSGQTRSLRRAVRVRVQ
jgi:extracellular elastinolytic metalloproteinase